MADATTQKEIEYLVNLIRTNPATPHAGMPGRVQYFADLNNDNWFIAQSFLKGEYKHEDQKKAAALVGEQVKEDLAIIDFKIAEEIMFSSMSREITAVSHTLRDTVKTNAEKVHADKPFYKDDECWNEGEKLAAKTISPEIRKHVEDLLKRHLPRNRGEWPLRGITSRILHAYLS